MRWKATAFVQSSRDSEPSVNENIDVGIYPAIATGIKKSAAGASGTRCDGNADFKRVVDIDKADGNLAD